MKRFSSLLMFIALNWTNWKDKFDIQYFMEMINEPHWTQIKAGLHTTWRTEFYCVCVANVFLPCVLCLPVLLGSTHIAVLLLVATGCNLEWWKHLGQKFLLTSHSLTSLQQTEVGESDTNTCNNITHIYFRYWSCWFCGLGRMGHQHSPESSSRWL